MIANNIVTIFLFNEIKQTVILIYVFTFKCTNKDSLNLCLVVDKSGKSKWSEI